MAVRPTVRPWLFLALAGLACGGGTSQTGTPAPAPARASRVPPPIMPLMTAALASQDVALLPLTLLVTDDSLMSLPFFTDHARALAVADSIVGAGFTSRAPEVKWTLPAELRKTARRAPGVVVDPDRMGQSIMRAPNLKDVPDPLRSSLRSMVALTGGRFAMIPAALSFLRENDGRTRAEIALVLADARTGKVVWRTLSTGFGATPEQALTQAIELVLPLVLGMS